MYGEFSSDGESAMSVLGAFAIQTHELFNELVHAGFNEEQAIKIVVGLATKE